MVLTLLFVAAVATEQHPAIGFDAAQLTKIYETHKKKKTRADQLFMKFTNNLGKVRTPDGLFWNPPTATLMTPTLKAAIDGSTDGREYNNDEKFKQFLSETSERVSKNPGGSVSNLYVYADLWAWPGISDWDGHITRLADQQDVRSVKFVLLTDDNPPIAIKPTIINKDGENVTESSFTIPQLSSTGASATEVKLPNGQTITSSTVTYSTARVGNATGYNASYSLQFSILDKNGEPLIKKSHKKLTLKVIRPIGEWQTRWMLGNLINP